MYRFKHSVQRAPAAGCRSRTAAFPARVILYADARGERRGGRGILLLNVERRSVSFNGRTALWLTRKQLTILAAVAARGLLTYQELVDFIWGADKNGGPDDFLQSIHLFQLRINSSKKLARLGLKLATRHGFGLELQPGPAPQRPISRTAKDCMIERPAPSSPAPQAAAEGTWHACLPIRRPATARANGMVIRSPALVAALSPN
ncbi:MAG: hypothetical protein ACREBU_02655 [Nitrososphaera sp.]